MTTTYTVEKPLQVWDDKLGTRVEIGPDRDGLELVEIRQYDEKGSIGARITLTVQEWELLRTYIVFQE